MNKLRRSYSVMIVTKILEDPKDRERTQKEIDNEVKIS
jgi:hypothetical protein